jgi:hypothetical protein
MKTLPPATAGKWEIKNRAIFLCNHEEQARGKARTQAEGRENKNVTGSS